MIQNFFALEKRKLKQFSKNFFRRFGRRNRTPFSRLRKRFSPVPRTGARRKSVRENIVGDIHILDDLIVVHAAADEVRAALPGDGERAARMLDACAKHLERDPRLRACGHVVEHLLAVGVHEPVVAGTEADRILPLVLVQMRGGIVHAVDGLHPEVGQAVVLHAELDSLEAVAPDAHRHAELP